MRGIVSTDTQFGLGSEFSQTDRELMAQILEIEPGIIRKLDKALADKRISVNLYVNFLSTLAHLRSKALFLEIKLVNNFFSFFLAAIEEDIRDFGSCLRDISFIYRKLNSTKKQVLVDLFEGEILLDEAVQLIKLPADLDDDWGNRVWDLDSYDEI